jgi:hypothetical protein
VSETWLIGAYGMRDVPIITIFRYVLARMKKRLPTRILAEDAFIEFNHGFVDSNGATIYKHES